MTALQALALRFSSGLSLRGLSVALTTLTLTLLAGGCASLPAPLESSSRPVSGYLDYSWDKNSVLFNTREEHLQTVFMDTFYPFDPSLRYNNAEALVRYELDHKPFVEDGVLMVALSDLRKIYAPYFSYTVDPVNKRFSVQHQFFRKRVISGSGSRAPKIEYTKLVWNGSYTLAQQRADVTRTAHKAVIDRNAIDKAPAVGTPHVESAALEKAPAQRDGRIFVPVASFLKSLGKTITDDRAGSGYLAVSHVDPQNTGDDLFNPQYASRGLPNTPITPARTKTMNGLLDGTINKGNLWFAYYLDELGVFTGKADSSGQDINRTVVIDRVLPYRLYVPTRYDAAVPSKFTFNLHGATGNENAPFERPNNHLKNHPSVIPGLNSLEGYADYYNYIVLSPNGWTRNPVWGSGPGEQILLHTLRLVKQRYQIDPKRMFIFGNSAGGAGAMNFVLRHGELFRAMAPTAPSRVKPFANQLNEKLLNLPTLLTCFSADVTVFYAGIPGRSCQTWYAQEMRGAAPNITAVTLENGHHSYGPASLNEITFDHFERALDVTPPKVVTAVRVVPDRNTAAVSTGGIMSSVTLGTTPVRHNGVMMMALDDLARIYGEKDFRVYDIHAYNQKPADLVSVKTVVFNKMSVNIKPGERFLRVGGTVHAGDTIDGKAKVSEDDPRADRRRLSVPTQFANGKLLVPAIEFMQLFGQTLTVE